jgi:hypothetical protein
MALPGQTFTLRRGALAEVAASASYVRCPPRARWPRRRFRGTITWLERYAPVTRRPLDSEGAAALQTELDAFARFLCGGYTFRALMSLEDVGARLPTFALCCLRAGGPPLCFAYEPQGARFAPIPSASLAELGDGYLAAYECWGSDLLALLRGEVSPTALSFARSRVVNRDPRVFPLLLNGELFMYAHPLRMPERFLALYRRVVAGIGLGAI